LKLLEKELLQQKLQEDLFFSFLSLRGIRSEPDLDPRPVVAEIYTGLSRFQIVGR